MYLFIMAMGHKNERRKIQIEICNVFLCFGELFSTICICYFCGFFFFFFLIGMYFVCGILAFLGLGCFVSHVDISDEMIKYHG